MQTPRQGEGAWCLREWEEGSDAEARVKGEMRPWKSKQKAGGGGL